MAILERLAPSRRFAATTSLVIGLHALVAICFWLTFCIGAPRVKTVLLEFKLRRPRATGVAVAVSDWAIASLDRFTLLRLFMLEMDAVVLLLLRRNQATRRLSWIWFALMLFGAMIGLVWTWISLLWPMITVQGLAGPNEIEHYLVIDKSISWRACCMISGRT
jgi:hypothetical protein